MKFKRKKVNSDPIQRQIADDIQEVKKSVHEGGIFTNDDFVRHNSIVSHFPKEKKLVVYNSVLTIIPTSKKDGRICVLGFINE